MNLTNILDKEAFLNEKLPLDISNDDHQMEIIEIEKFLQKGNFNLEQLAEAFELNRYGKLQDYLFEKNAKKVIAYQKVGLRYVSEILFAYKEYKRINLVYKPFELPPAPVMSSLESYESCKKIVIEKYKTGKTDYFELAFYLLVDFYEFERESINLSKDEQINTCNEAEKWLKLKGIDKIKTNGGTMKELINLEIGKKDVYSLAKTYILAKFIIESHLMDEM